jgi:hypothetical protein
MLVSEVGELTSMLNYKKIKDKPKIFRSLTGLPPAAFGQLVEPFKQAYAQTRDEADVQRKTPRQRRRGGGRKATLESIEDKLVFILFYETSGAQFPGSAGAERGGREPCRR